eukprot:753382-Hanusia_phi.AAC.4
MRTKLKIATLVFYMAKEERFANKSVRAAVHRDRVTRFRRLLKEQGVIKSLTGLLDSEHDEVGSRAAAALANISYWSNANTTYYSNLRVQVAL